MEHEEQSQYSSDNYKCSEDSIMGDTTLDMSAVTAATEDNDSFLNSSMSSTFSQSQSAAIRSSRRRVKKGTAVVLNTDRLQKYLEKENHQQQHSQGTSYIEEPASSIRNIGTIPEELPSPAAKLFDKSATAAAATAAVGDQLDNSGDDAVDVTADESKDSYNSSFANDPEEQIQRVKSEILANIEQLQRLQQKKLLHQHSSNSSTADCNILTTATATATKVTLGRHALSSQQLTSLLKLQIFWRSCCEYRKQRRLLFGKLTPQQSQRVFSLLLGHRIRWLMRASNIAMKRKAMADIRSVLLDLINNIPLGEIQTKIRFQETESPQVLLWNELHRPVNNIRDIQQQFPQLSQADLTLAKSLAKQFNAEKRHFLLLLFEGCSFRPYPLPGFNDFGVAIRRALKTPRVTTTTAATAATAAGGGDKKRQSERSCDCTATATAIATSRAVTLSPMRDVMNSPQKQTVEETPPNLRRAMQLAQQLATDSSSSSSGKPPPFPLSDSSGDDRSAAAVDNCTSPSTAIANTATTAATTAAAAVGAPRLRPLKDILASKSSEVATDTSTAATATATTATAASSSSQSNKAPAVRPFTSPDPADRAIKSATAAAALVSASTSDLMAHPEFTSAVNTTPYAVHRSSTSTAAATNSAAAARIAAASRATPLSHRQRQSSKAHIQLDVLSAERLMPAKKGAPLKDENGNAIPDRIPCLKIQLLMPGWIGTGSSKPATAATADVAGDKVKKIHQEIRDFDVVTWNPVWDAKFTVNLPCTRTIVQQIAAASTDYYQSQLGVLSDGDYEVIRKQLLQWWASGTIHLEVFDKERFNADIFMGQIDLLLSGFMVLIKKPEDLEIKGNFHLEKSNPKDRVSGSVRLHAYLHVPEKVFIESLLRQSAGVSSSTCEADTAASNNSNSNSNSYRNHHQQQQQLEVSPSIVPANKLNVVKAKTRRSGATAGGKSPSNSPGKHRTDRKRTSRASKNKSRSNSNINGFEEESIDAVLSDEDDYYGQSTDNTLSPEAATDTAHQFKTDLSPVPPFHDATRVGSSDDRSFRPVAYSSKFMQALASHAEQHGNLAARSVSRQSVSSSIELHPSDGGDDSNSNSRSISSSARNQQERAHYSVDNKLLSKGGEASYDGDSQRTRRGLLLGIKRRETALGKKSNTAQQKRGDDSSSYTYVVQEPADDYPASDALTAASTASAATTAATGGRRTAAASRGFAHRSVDVPLSSAISNDAANANRPRTANAVVAAGSNGAKRRSFIADITKQLDGLSVVQHSADQMLGNFQRKLAEKQRFHHKEATDSPPPEVDQQEEVTNVTNAAATAESAFAATAADRSRVRRPPPPPPPLLLEETLGSNSSVKDGSGVANEAPLHFGDSLESSSSNESEDLDSNSHNNDDDNSSSDDIDEGDNTDSSNDEMDDVAGQSTRKTFGDLDANQERGNEEKNAAADDDDIDTYSQDDVTAAVDDGGDHENGIDAWERVHETDAIDASTTDAIDAAVGGFISPGRNSHNPNDTSSYYSNTIMEEDFSFTNTSKLDGSRLMDNVADDDEDNAAEYQSEEELIVVSPKQSSYSTAATKESLNDSSSFQKGHFKNLRKLVSASSSPQRSPATAQSSSSYNNYSVGISSDRKASRSNSNKKQPVPNDASFDRLSDSNYLKRVTLELSAYEL